MNVLGFASPADWNVFRLGVLSAHDRQSPLLSNGREAILIQDRVQQIDGFILAQRLIAPDIHFAFHIGARFDVDDETRRVAQIVQHHLQRHAAEVQTQPGLSVRTRGGGRGSWRLLNVRRWCRVLCLWRLVLEQHRFFCRW